VSLGPGIRPPVDWSQVSAYFASEPPPGYPAYNRDQNAYNKARAEFYRTPAGRGYMRQERHDPVPLQAGGAFRIENVMPGGYSLQASLGDPRGPGRPAAPAMARVEIPEPTGGAAAGPLDIGTVVLAPPPVPATTPAAPPVP
jgi:hypothetical protein